MMKKKPKSCFKPWKEGQCRKSREQRGNKRGLLGWDSLAQGYESPLSTSEQTAVTQEIPQFLFTSH